MISLKLALAILFVHWLADFVLQTDKQAKNKSSSNKWLTIHVTIYCIPFLIFGWKFAVINSLAHWLVDFVTSRLSGHFYRKGDIHNFFVVIGFDQFLHVATLLLTASVML